MTSNCPSEHHLIFEIKDAKVRWNRYRANVLYYQDYIYSHWFFEGSNRQWCCFVANCNSGYVLHVLFALSLACLGVETYHKLQSIGWAGSPASWDPMPPQVHQQPPVASLDGGEDLAAPHFSHQFLPRGVSADAAARWCRHVTCTLLPFFKPHQLNPCMHFFPSRVFLIVLVRSSIVFLWFCKSPISSAVFICTLLPLLLDGSWTSLVHLWHLWLASTTSRALKDLLPPPLTTRI